MGLITNIESDKSNSRQKIFRFKKEIIEIEGERHYNDRSFSSHLGMRLSRIILSFAFIIMTFVLLSMANLRPMGYVVNIYSVIPETLVPSLIFCFSISCLLVFSKYKFIRNASIILLFIIIITILLIPYALGYYSMGRADDMSYLGEYIHISNSGHIAGWDIYPAGPIIGASIVVLCGIGASTTSFIIPIFFSILFIIGLNIFGHRFSKDQTFRNVLLISSFVLYLGPYNFLNTPHSLFFSFLPLFIYVIFKHVESKNIAFSILVIIFSLLLPFTHPFIFFFILVLMTSLLVFKPVIKRLINGDLNRLKNPILIQLIGFMAWFIYSGTLLGDFQLSVSSFLNKTTEPVILETTNKFVTSGLGPLSLLNFFMVYYGRYIIPTIVIFGFLIIYYRRIDPESKLKKSVSLLIMMYSITFIIEIILFVNPIISHQPDRMTNLIFLVYFQVPLFAFALLFFFKEKLSLFYHPLISKTIVILIIISTFGLSLLGTFDSPDINRTNAALTINEVEGMQWIYENRVSHNMAATVSQIDRFHDLFDDGVSDNYTSILDHFGYNEGSGNITESVTDFEGPLYLVTLTLDKSLYEEVLGYKSIGRYTYADYQKLVYDNSVSRIFTGRDIDISLLYH